METSLARLQASVESGDENPIVREYIASLKRSHARVVEKTEDLYASLNVPQEYPELEGLPLNFVQVLLLARDLKINIRKRAIGSFFEWDKLNRAAGGRDQPLGAHTRRWCTPTGSRTHTSQVRNYTSKLKRPSHGALQPSQLQ